MKPHGAGKSWAAASDHIGGDGGFTLVEVMVALTIFSLVMMATVSGFRTLADTQRAIERTTTRIDEVRSVSSFLRELLESAVVAQDSAELTLGGGSSEATYFVWGDDFLEFESTVLFGEQYGGSYLVRVGKENANLVLRWQERPANGVPEDWEDMPSRVMIENLEQFSLDTRPEYGQEWSSRKSMEGLPVPVSIRLKIKAAGRNWPVLILQVQ